MGRAGVDKLGGLRGVPSAPQKGQMRQVSGMMLAQFGQLYLLSGKVLPAIVFPPSTMFPVSDSHKYLIRIFSGFRLRNSSMV